MRQIELPGTTLRSSILGMGCASLGSRYGTSTGLRALEAAFDRGITWYDVAPAYGAGEAEPILARFLKGKRDQVNICTKAGLLPPHQGYAKRLLMPVARPVVAKLKGLRSTIRQSGATANTRLPITPQMIETSITRSLVRLGTDRVEIFALHDPAPQDVNRDDVLRALERVIARGQARYIAVAGELPAALAGAASGHFSLIQTADDPATDPLDNILATAPGPIATVSHSVLGAGGVQARLAARLAGAPEWLTAARAAGFDGTTETVAAQLLLARAFVANGSGPVLASMFGAGHLAINITATRHNAVIGAAARSLVREALA
ncbi:aldo/keto reductase [Sphingomonas populi]|uniref:Aldo/keto reductase n=1 Tax=Sphingomonas populi TaxID=2484750 RepID=A0A4Q6XLI3_9SPHN|nr:aldo/keto reductase [Sphingomonas populi]RZF60741.1 aldo/keto reductase [Sphingomonas populi]